MAYIVVVDKTSTCLLHPSPPTTASRGCIAPRGLECWSMSIDVLSKSQMTSVMFAPPKDPKTYPRSHGPSTRTHGLSTQLRGRSVDPHLRSTVSQVTNTSERTSESRYVRVKSLVKSPKPMTSFWEQRGRFSTYHV